MQWLPNVDLTKRLLTVVRLNLTKYRLEGIDLEKTKPSNHIKKSIWKKDIFLPFSITNFFWFANVHVLALAIRGGKG